MYQVYQLNQIREEVKSKFMRQYNDILNEIAELPHGFGSVDILDTSISELNVSNFHRNNNDNRMIICISRTEGSAGTDIGFALADKLRLNYYDAEIFKDLVIRKDAEKDARWKSKKINVSSINTGTKIPIDQSIYPKKPGILTPFSSAMDLTIKLGALPIYVPAPINTAPQDIAVRSFTVIIPALVVIPFVNPNAASSDDS